MKTKIISTLKKELLLVELPENGYYEEYCDGIEVGDFLTDEVLTLTNYTLLGKPDEIKEEDAMELVEQSIHSGLFAHYVKGIPVNTYCYKTALDSFHSALESEIYWDVNPFESKADSLVTDNSANGCALYRKAFHEFCEAEEKTFDRNKTLIFAKL